MAWSGGVYTRNNGEFTGSGVWASDASAGYVILASRHDAHDQDLADGLNQCVLADGSKPFTGAVNMGGYKINNLGAATTNTDAAQYGQTFQSLSYSTGHDLTLTRPNGTTVTVNIQNSVNDIFGLQGELDLKLDTSGTAQAAVRLDANRNITVTSVGRLTGSGIASFNGTADAEIEIDLAPSSSFILPMSQITSLVSSLDAVDLKTVGSVNNGGTQTVSRTGRLTIVNNNATANTTKGLNTDFNSGDIVILNKTKTAGTMTINSFTHPIRNEVSVDNSTINVTGAASILLAFDGVHWHKINIAG